MSTWFGKDEIKKMLNKIFPNLTLLVKYVGEERDIGRPMPSFGNPFGFDSSNRFSKTQKTFNLDSVQIQLHKDIYDKHEPTNETLYHYIGANSSIMHEAAIFKFLNETVKYSGYSDYSVYTRALGRELNQYLEDPRTRAILEPLVKNINAIIDSSRFLRECFSPDTNIYYTHPLHAVNDKFAKEFAEKFPKNKIGIGWAITGDHGDFLDLSKLNVQIDCYTDCLKDLNIGSEEYNEKAQLLKQFFEKQLGTELSMESDDKSCTFTATLPKFLNKFTPPTPIAPIAPLPGAKPVSGENPEAYSERVGQPKKSEFIGDGDRGDTKRELDKPDKSPFSKK